MFQWVTACRGCGKSQIWVDTKGEYHCMICEPPRVVLARAYREHQQNLQKRAVREMEMQEEVDRELHGKGERSLPGASERTH